MGVITLVENILGISANSYPSCHSLLNIRGPEVDSPTRLDDMPGVGGRGIRFLYSMRVLPVVLFNEIIGWSNITAFEVVINFYGQVA